MKGFIKTTKDYYRYSKLINIKYIQNIEVDSTACIDAMMEGGGIYVLFEPKNDFERSDEFLNRMIDRIFLVLSDCEYDNVFIDIEVIKNDITKELKEEREMTIEKYLQDKNENIKDSNCEKSFIEPRVEAKKFLEAHFEAYQKYDEIVLNDIGMILTECFNFEANSDNGMITFNMNGAQAGSEPCNYNVYLSRGYICLEEEDNTCRENIWNVDSIKQFIDLIKDIKEDV